jgi:hypothetical protein
MWWTDRNVYIDPRKYSNPSDPGYSYLRSLIVHENVHLRQGPFTALSVYGELQAWQAGFSFLRKLDPGRINPTAEAILRLRLGWDRAVLRLSVGRMLCYAPHYRIRRLPLYPLPWEIRYLLTKQEPR